VQVLLGYQFIVAHCFPLDDHHAVPVKSNDVKGVETEGAGTAVEATITERVATEEAGVSLNKPEAGINANELGVFVVRVPNLA
jgi:hypothetical protein